MTTQKRTTRKKPARTARPRAAATAPESQLRQVWLAGLGAVVTAGETANGLVDELIVRGRKQEPATRAAAEKAVRAARGAVEGVAAEAGRRSQQLVKETMSRLGVKEQPRSRNILHRLGDFAEALL
ncbi:MAG: phasin family protein [Thermoanaerobaculia bacterium]|nr:phasin family protein [Thermoanaerobaculia bacterium]